MQLNLIFQPITFNERQNILEQLSSKMEKNFKQIKTFQIKIIRLQAKVLTLDVELVFNSFSEVTFSAIQLHAKICQREIVCCRSGGKN